MSYTITQEENPLPEDIKILSSGLAAYGEEIVGPTWFKDTAFYLRDEAGEIIGGVYGNYGSFGWMYVDTLWVSPAARGQGHGHDLMHRIESAALEHGCTAAYLSTFSFQAPGFYKKLGYEAYGELENFPGEHRRIFMRKKF